MKPLYRLYAASLHSALLCLLTLPLAVATDAHDKVAPLLAFLAAGHAVRGLLVSLADARMTPNPKDRLVALWMAAGSAVAALGLILGGLPGCGPDPLRLWAAGNALAPTLQHLRSGGAWPVAGAELQPRGGSSNSAAFVALIIPIALLAGLCSGIVVQPACRWAKAYWLAISPPSGVASITTPHALHLAFMRLSFILTLAAPMTPVFAAQAFWSGNAIAKAAAAHHDALLSGLLLSAGTVHLMTLRGSTQTWLDAALVAWHQLRHVTGVDASLTVIVMRQKFERAIDGVCYAALLHTAVGELLLAPGALMLSMRLADGARNVVPLEVYIRGTAFLGAWTAAVWTMAASMQLLALRNGLVVASA